jgi:hypothetical protein
VECRGEKIWGPYAGGCACSEGYERKDSKVGIERCLGELGILCIDGDCDGSEICIFETTLDCKGKDLCVANWVRR